MFINHLKQIKAATVIYSVASVSIFTIDFEIYNALSSTNGHAFCVIYYPDPASIKNSTAFGNSWIILFKSQSVSYSETVIKLKNENFWNFAGWKLDMWLENPP